MALRRGTGRPLAHRTLLTPPSCSGRVKTNQAVVFTHDLDFGILLAVTQAGRPSVIQVRTQDVSPAHLGGIVVNVLKAHADALGSGALVTVDEARARVRILPIEARTRGV